MIKDRKKMGWGKVIPQLFCCASTVALFFRHGLALSYSWPAATGRSGVTCNQCHFEAKDETLLLLPVPVNEETRVLTSTICHKSGTDISFLKKDSPILNHIIYRFFFISEQVSLVILHLLWQRGSRYGFPFTVPID